MSQRKPSGRKDTIPLFMECYDEDLSPSQIVYFNKSEIDYHEMVQRLESMVKSRNQASSELGVQNVVQFHQNNVGHIQQTTLASPAVTNSSLLKSKLMSTTGSGVPVPVVPATALPTSATAPLVLQGTQVSQVQPTGTYQLLMDPRLGILVGTMAQPSPTSPVGPVTQIPHVTKTPTVQTNIMKPVSTVTKPSNPAVVVPRGAGQTMNLQCNPIGPAAPRTIGAVVVRSNVSNPQNKLVMPTVMPSFNQVPAYRIMRPAVTVTTTPPSSNQLAVSNRGVRTVEVTVTSQPANAAKNKMKPGPEENRCYEADSREITFNKLNGKTFPSLVVVARPHLRIKDMSQASINQERTYLDGKVKGVLMFSPTKFTEWLIQQGLVRSEQYCNVHINPDRTPVKLKLGMYSDVSKFPHTGGYVWINDCCPQRFVSVFSGSIFEGSSSQPNVLLKLMYHWCCQTSVQNVIQWVKVESHYVKSFYANLRAICSAAVNEKYERLGGKKKKIEVGVISLGTTSQDGNMRQVKVEVLGIYDPETKSIRLRAVEPLLDGEKNYKRRFCKILEPLQDWVHKDSTILTDFTVDRSALVNMGYTTIHQVSINDNSPSNYKNSNANVMEYLRRIVPRMFQNTLSLLSRQIIQQFLDELVWRERWGPIPSKAFDSLISDLADQTKIDAGKTLSGCLSTIAGDPFKNWKYENWRVFCPKEIDPASRNKIILLPSSGTVPPPAPASVQAANKRGYRKRNSDAPASSGANSNTLSQSELPLTTPTIQPPPTIQPSPSPPPPPPSPPPPPPPPPSNNAHAAEEVVTVTTPLQSYYYGTIDGDKDILEKESKCRINMNCPSCRTLLHNNIDMMHHLLALAVNESNSCNSEEKRIPQCRYCLKTFVTDFWLLNHIDEVHKNPIFNLVCLLCEEKFRDRTTLILHMHRNHTELELPYQCGVCFYRCSEHHLAIDHFYEMHNDGEHLQCPCCLKVVTVSNEGERITQNLHFFLNHLKKHSRRSLGRKCNKCVLVFIHEGILENHKLKDHETFKDYPSIERYPITRHDAIMMPKPLSSGPAVEPPQLFKNKEPYDSNSFSANKFQSLSISGASHLSECCECEGKLDDKDHFLENLSCKKCQYMTSCVRAANEHYVMFHDTKYSKEEFSMGKRVILDKTMYCICGFKSNSGNKLAKHLSSCGKKSAYPSREVAALNIAQITPQTSTTESLTEAIIHDIPQSKKRSLIFSTDSIECDEPATKTLKTEPNGIDEISNSSSVMEVCEGKISNSITTYQSGSSGSTLSVPESQDEVSMGQNTQSTVTSINSDEKDSTEGEKSRTESEKDSTEGEKSSTEGEKNSTEGEKSSTEGEKNSTEGEKSSTEGEKNSTEGEKSSTEGEKNSTEGEKNSTEGEKSSTEGEKSSSEVNACTDLLTVD